MAKPSNEGYEPSSRIGKAIGHNRYGGAHVSLIEKAEVRSGEETLLGGFNEVQQGPTEAPNGLSFDPDKKPGDQMVKPRFDPKQLYGLVRQNNALDQLISAMEINIDGTGYTIMRRDGEESEDEDPEKITAESFFNEPFPGIPFNKIRRELRRDLESTGNAYLEVIRSVGGAIALLRRLPTESVRMIRLEDPVMTDRQIERNGELLTIKMPVRERRFVQKTHKKPVYFKEYGSVRSMDRETGEWAEGSLPPEQRATEILHFGVARDTDSPYSLPRWINQLPSVLGSRKAEELNLDFFNAGGLPPALIMIQGGTMATEVRNQLNSYLSGKGASKHRAAVIEAYSTSGSVDGAGAPVKVSVERFGSEKQNDSMFEKYDEKSEKRVRSAFRLPPLFVGRTEGFNFATAFASYVVAEAQVFQPEREEFDAIINMTLMREIAPNYEIRSNPLTVRDIETQMKALGLAKSTGAVSAAEAVRVANEVADLNIQIDEEMAERADAPPEPVDFGNRGGGSGGGNGSGQPNSTQGRAPKKSSLKMVSELVRDWAVDYGHYLLGDSDLSEDSARHIRSTVDKMDGAVRYKFDQIVSEVVFGGALENDPEGSAEILKEVEQIEGYDHCGCQE